MLKIIASAAAAIFLAPPVSLSAPISNTQAGSHIVFSPRITYPNAGAVWPMGSVQNVTWDTANLPSEKHKATGLVLLGYLKDGSEHLDVRNPLAAGFRMDSGSVSVRVPMKLKERSDYICVVFGDSGNISQQFRITKGY